MNLKHEVRKEFYDRYGSWPDLVVRSPGRVNLIGERE
jgi:galactokinase